MKGSHDKDLRYDDRTDYLSDRTNRQLTTALKIFLFCGAALEFFQGNLLGGIATIGVLVVSSVPVVLGEHFKVRIPPEFELCAVLFVMASLFLGEVQGYYLKFWWWDLVLHTASGFLLGIFGFLLVHVLNEKENIQLSLKPGFVAIFAFMFALGMGALWEIMEFTIDQLFGTNMQKSGLQDTMGDLIVDSIGALIIAIIGYFYLSKIGTESFLERWIRHFIVMNTHLFKKKHRHK